jgi:hypothetical protein
MDIQKILAELRQQRDQISAVIEALGRIAYQQAPRRGRPPKWLAMNGISETKNGTNSAVNGSHPLAPQRKPAPAFAAANGMPRD